MLDSNRALQDKAENPYLRLYEVQSARQISAGDDVRLKFRSTLPGRAGKPASDRGTGYLALLGAGAASPVVGGLSGQVLGACSRVSPQGQVLCALAKLQAGPLAQVPVFHQVKHRTWPLPRVGAPVRREPVPDSRNDWDVFAIFAAAFAAKLAIRMGHITSKAAPVAHCWTRWASSNSKKTSNNQPWPPHLGSSTNVRQLSWYRS